MARAPGRRVVAVAPALALVALALALVGCGSAGSATTGSSSPSASAARSESPTVTHPSAVGEPAMVPVPGYDYVDGTAEELRDLSSDDLIEAINDEDPGAITGHAWHWVEHGDNVFMLELIELAPEYAVRVTEVGGLLAIAETYPGAPGHAIEQIVIATEPVVVESYRTTDGGRWVDFVWMHDRALTRASGLDCQPELLAFVTAYLKAAHA